MTTSEAEKIIIEACQKANPKLMELSLGCEVKTRTNGTVQIVIYEDFPEESYMNYILPNGLLGDEDGKRFYENEILEILGHPPQLTDVLLAIGENSGLAIESTGQFGELTHEGLNVRGYPAWNLLLPLSEQSDEVKLFLADILK